MTAQQSVSLLIPGGFDSVPLTADVAGVGPSGETTWIVRASQSLDEQGGHPGGTGTYTKLSHQVRDADRIRILPLPYDPLNEQPPSFKARRALHSLTQPQQKPPSLLASQST